MEHTLIDVSEETGIQHLVLFKADNNLDKKDNLASLPQEAAVYAICGRVNGQPANCRIVGEAVNLQQAIRAHFEKSESYECLRIFMQSIKTKVLVYQLMPNATPKEREMTKKEWEARFKPDCNETLNEIH